MKMKGKNIKIIICMMACVFFIMPTTMAIDFNQPSPENPSFFQLQDHMNEDTQSQLPYWLDGTILDGNTRVIITESGEPPEDSNPNDYDYVISYNDMNLICENARLQFLNTYGIDPCESSQEQQGYNLNSLYIPDTVDISLNDDDGYTSFTNNLYVQNEQINIIEYKTNLNKFIYFPNPPCAEYTDARLYSFDYGPRQINGQIQLKVFLARDSVHRLINPNAVLSPTQQGYSRFSQFNVQPCSPVYYSGIWDAGDCPLYDMYQLLDDLSQDCSQYRTADNQLIMGWVRKGDHNGIADLPGFFNVIAWTSTTLGHPKDCIVQHELSHNFACPEGGWWPWDHGWRSCVMNYWYCYWGTHIWCNQCRTIINNFMWRTTP